MTLPEPTIRVNVDVTNPGQFFACCGLLELADRLWPGAEGWFEDDRFSLTGCGQLTDIQRALCSAELREVHPEEATSTPLHLGAPFRVRLDWWLDAESGGRELKVWAGSMEHGRIASAMRATLARPERWTPDLFDFATIAYDVANPEKKVEPFYFDARRGPNAHSRDVGFSANDLQLPTSAVPAVEVLTLIGLQRFRPLRTKQPRVFDFFPWTRPLPVALAAVACNGQLPRFTPQAYRFENWYRTGQKKHKAFRPAVALQPERTHE